jgi:OOP family OmpA-OmpF porin
LGIIGSSTRKEESVFTNYNIGKLLLGFSAAALLLGLAAIPNMAFADDWYGGIGIGRSKSPSDSIPGFSGTQDDKDTAGKVFVGFVSNPFVAVELGYVNLGEFKIDGKINGIAASETDKIKGINLTILGTIPVAKQFSALIRLGFFRWDVRTSCSLGGADCSGDGQNTNLTFGLGGQLDFNKTIGMRVEWERFRDIGNDNTGQGKVDLYSASLVFKFK